MTNKPTTPLTTNQRKVALMLLGLALTLGWALIVATINHSINSSCAIISLSNCSQAIPGTFVFLPILAGSILIPISIIYGGKFSRLAQLVMTLVLGTVMFFVACYIIALVEIG